MKMFHGGKPWLRIALALAVSLSGALAGAADGNRGWSADLSAYGMKAAYGEAGQKQFPIVSVAATNGVVAAALGIPLQSAERAEQSNRRGTFYTLTLLLFDANSGKFLTKRGPWSSASSFELYATAQGNFLVLLRDFEGARQNSGDTLFVLSPSGEELRKLDLPPSVIHARTSWNEFLVSSTGRSVLVGQILDETVHYRILQSDTLETKLEWTEEAGSHSPRIIALSDKELLGFRNPENREKRLPANAERDLYVRPFDGAWQRLPGSFDVSHHGRLGQGLNPSQLSFLSDHVLVGVNATRKEREGSIVLLQSGGTIVSPPVIPKLPERTSLTGPVAVSAEGHYFAAGFQHQPWISHLLVDVMTLDITFWNDDFVFLLWEASSPEPVARIPLGSDVRAASFSPDDPPTLAYLSGATLKVVRFEPKPNDRKAH
jgi:hypothetical protein